RLPRRARGPAEFFRLRRPAAVSGWRLPLARMAGKKPGPVRSRRGGARAARVRLRAAPRDGRSDRRLRRGFLLLPRGSGSRRARTARRVEMLVRPGHARPPPQVGDRRQLLRVQGVSRRAQSSVLPVEVDAPLSRVRLAAVHAEPLRHAGLRGPYASGALRRVREGILAGAALRPVDPGAAGRAVPAAPDARQAETDPE